MLGMIFESVFFSWLSIATLLTYFIYWYSTSTFNYWKEKGIPYLKPTPGFGNTRRMFFKTSFAEQFKIFYDKFDGERFCGVFQFRSPILVVRDPDIIKLVMVKDFPYFQDRRVSFNEKKEPLSAHLLNMRGNQWRRLRAKLTPTFTSGKMKMMFSLMNECAEELTTFLEVHASRNEDLEVKEVMAKFTTDIIGSCVFGLKCNSLKDPDSEFRSMGRKVVEPSLNNVVRRLLSLLVPILGIRVLPWEVTQFFISAVRETIKYREQHNIVRNDFMQQLIQLKNQEQVRDDEILDKGNLKKEFSTNGISLPTKNGENVAENIVFTDSRLASQAFIFFLAGFETSCTTLSFCLYELAVNPDIQTKLREEVDVTLQKFGGITYDAVHSMRYLSKVIDETLRKHPPAANITRVVTQPYTIPETSAELEKGIRVVIPVYAIHHDPRYYPEPDRFDPERFCEEAKSLRPHFTYLPFGEGPRNCIGMRFGLLQTKVGVSVLLSNYEFSVCEKTKQPLDLDPKSFITSAKGGIWLKISRRSSQK
ncbi:probable cytochrome P450 6a14 [Zootermopsis nevadensis]|uniref:Putative cytochrome P450 6a14 n=1 Tax=Zootermopsis nevadensis TaxID=136037 RepID=A0A067QXQ5_ZOONE|nr:probable cytochrome P450 6a14 [Zootermopsis nevadensis]KDR10910.1 putative cytochrome P450 6a14 [Zootermopsis nevadensis]